MNEGKKCPAHEAILSRLYIEADALIAERRDARRGTPDAFWPRPKGGDDRSIRLLAGLLAEIAIPEEERVGVSQRLRAIASDLRNADVPDVQPLFREMSSFADGIVGGNAAHP